MNILVNIIVPSIASDYDVFLPKCVQIRDIIPLITSAVYELSSAKFIASGEEVLCYKERNLLLTKETTLELQGVQNGDHLILL